jgi:hypothetical protein
VYFVPDGAGGADLGSAAAVGACADAGEGWVMTVRPGPDAIGIGPWW